MNSNTLLYLGIAIIAGLLGGRLVKLIKLPNVTGYLLVGLLIGPHMLKIIPENFLQSASIVSEMALGFIAFTIGCTFKISYFKKIGFTPVIIAITEALGAVILVTGTLILFKFPPQLAILLGAISAATAPAATIMVIKQYKAKGPMTDLLLSVVAIDDAVALIAFGFAVAITKMITPVVAIAGQVAEKSSALMSMLAPLYEVGISLVVGAILGFLFAVPMRWFKKDSNRVCLVVAFVFLTSAIAGLIHGSPLLTCMTMGAAFTNLRNDADKVNDMVDFITPPLYMMFFVFAGAELNLGILPTVGLVGILYIVTRAIGKYFGAFLGATITKTPKNIRNYLGFTLIPQAGVAIGLSLVAESVVPDYAPTIRAVVLCATLVYEIVGAVLAKGALQKVGEIKST